MKRSLLVVLGLILPLAGVEATPLSLPVYGDEVYRPISYVDSVTLKPAGIFPRLLQALGPGLGVVFRVELYPWARAYSLAASGVGGLMGVSDNPQRRALFDYTDVVFYDDIQIVVPRDSVFPFEKLSDLAGKSLGGNVGASYGTEIDQALKAGLFTIDRDANQANRLKKVLAHRIDGALIGNGEGGLQTILRSDPELWAARDRLVVLERPLTRDPLYVAFPKALGLQDLVARFNRALAQQRSSGALARLVQEELQR